MKFSQSQKAAGGGAKKSQAVLKLFMQNAVW